MSLRSGCHRVEEQEQARHLVPTNPETRVSDGFPNSTTEAISFHATADFVAREPTIEHPNSYNHEYRQILVLLFQLARSTT